MDSIAGRNKDSANSLVNGSSVHIDGRTERKDKGSNLPLCTKLFRTLHINGQSSHRGCRRKSKHNGRHHALKELYGRQPSQYFHRSGIHENGMHNIADISRKKNRGKRTDNFRTVCRNHWAKQTKYTDWRQAQNHFHTLHENVVKIIESGYDTDVLLLHQNNGESEDKSHHDNLQHICLDHRLNKV